MRFKNEKIRFKSAAAHLVCLLGQLVLLILLSTSVYSSQLDSRRVNGEVEVPGKKEFEAKRAVFNIPFIGGGCAEFGGVDTTSLTIVEDMEIPYLEHVIRVGNRAPMVDRFYNPNGRFSESRRTADKYTHPEWKRMSQIERAHHLFEIYIELIDRHGFKGRYRPSTLVCKTVRESCFRPQDDAPGRKSSAAGLSMVVKRTLRGFFRTSNWFRSQIKGLENVRSPAAYRSFSEKSILAQAEIGLAVMHMKSLELRSSSEKRILEFYYGSRSRSANAAYARRILSCSDCIERAGNKLSISCLRKSRKSCFTKKDYVAERKFNTRRSRPAGKSTSVATKRVSRAPSKKSVSVTASTRESENVLNSQDYSR